MRLTLGREPFVLGVDAHIFGLCSHQRTDCDYKGRTGDNRGAAGTPRTEHVQGLKPGGLCVTETQTFQKQDCGVLVD